ncbi:MAG: serine hydrolase [Alphaproteobacteria bacterium]|nr:serine hydrolase [Alphaproteobacteria bacterium]
MTMLVRLTGAAFAMLWLSAAAIAQDLTVADPQRAGFSAERLARLTPWYRSQIDAGKMPGAVVAIARDGKLATLQAIGTYDRAGKIPLKPDAIFWIASMTKPVTSVAAMMLVEEGKLELDAPVARYLPELEDMRVGLERVPQKRPMQVIDLLRHTSGLTYPEEGDDALHRTYAGVSTFRRDKTLADFVSALAAMPLLHQPGEVWEYSWGVDVLARVIEVVSVQTFDRFLESRIFKPLRMVDTGFSVPEAKLGRLVDPIPGGRPSLWDVTKPAKLFSGGGGLASTAPDYLRFCQMLLNGGELDGVRILAARTIQQMTTNSLPADVRFAGSLGQYVGPRVGTGWGLGFAIRTNPDFSLLPGAAGSFNWSGVWGTYFWIDPAERLIAVQMIQVPPEAGVAFRDAFRHLTYAALGVPQQAVSPPPSAAGFDVLKTYVGTYDFGRSLSSRDRQAPFPAFAFGGVGLEVQLTDGQVVVRNPFDGAPAAKAGVRLGDLLTKIDDVPLEGLGINEVLARLRGAPGTSVRLKISRKGEAAPIDVAVVREVIRQFGATARIEVRVVDEGLTVEAVGPWSVLDFEKGQPVAVKPLSDKEFRIDGGDGTRIAFVTDDTGKVVGAILNPGPWEVRAARIN